MIRSLAWLALSILMCVGVRAEAQQDFSAETYPVDFLPWANRKIAIRDQDGNLIGYSKNQAPFRIVVDGNAMRAARTPEGIDIGKLLSNMAPRRGPDGHLYLTMTLEQDVSLDGQTTLSSKVVDANGQTVKRQIQIDVEDFYVTRSLQPSNFSTSSADAPAPERSQVQMSNDVLAREGVTEATRPEERIEDTEPLPSLGREDEEDEKDNTPAGFVVNLGKGAPFPTRFLSSPLCSKNGETHVTTSGLGPRGRRGRDGRCRASNGRVMSCFHQGLDISARVGTPILAAADGCFKVKKSEGRRTHPAQGTKIDKRDLWEGGYGYTIRLTHGNEFETQYSHLSRLSPKVRWGMCVKRGEIIGYSGNTGQVTGQHFHFGVAYQRRTINPASRLISTTGRFLSPSCSAIPKYEELDQTMRAALRGGGSGGSRTGGGTRTARSNR